VDLESGKTYPEGSSDPVQDGGRRMSKITYWKCVDCNSMINDENMHDVDQHPVHWKWMDRYAEFCYGCMAYNPEVVLAYD
jgi:hypothetical protein